MRINKHSWCCVPSCCWCQHLTRGRPNTWPAVGWDSWDWGLRVNIASLEHIPGYRVTSWQWMLLQTIAPQSWYICLLSFHNFWLFLCAVYKCKSIWLWVYILSSGAGRSEWSRVTPHQWQWASDHHPPHRRIPHQWSFDHWGERTCTESSEKCDRDLNTLR